MSANTIITYLLRQLQTACDAGNRTVASNALDRYEEAVYRFGAAGEEAISAAQATFAAYFPA